MGVAVGDYDRNGTDGHLQDQLRRRHLDALRERRQGLLRRPHVRRPASASTRAGSAGASASSTSTTTAGSICSSSTATSTRRSSASRPRPATSSARSSIATSATAASRTSRSGSGRRSRHPPPAAARPSAISTTTATSTSSSTTSTTRRICSGSTRRPDAHWLTLKLVGTQSNRSAIGARVRLVSAGGTQVQEVRGGGSYYSQNDLRVHFGLGTADARRARRGALAERARGGVDRPRRPTASSR